MLAPSKHFWLNWDLERLKVAYTKAQNTQRGTDLHALACMCIKQKQRLPNSKLSINQYVNDAIGFRMTPEQPLFVSYNAFGTADAISFREEKKIGPILRIHDLKTGVSPVWMEQLEIYAAFFYLEYGLRPRDSSIELRIYQNNAVVTENPAFEDIQAIMDKIIEFDQSLEKWNTNPEE
jgi:hypothetical protein